ncbi:hypothetical protein EYF80_057908 [Liparis tanakae]|uniref:Uncharacterized protein n=1 Tax=Liparis tanakae TaxID=230148 RepID=A0A4Z2EU74_9TELE|nr:hypothetical protein EYF80_057908 [Liparis tanakae]
MFQSNPLVLRARGDRLQVLCPVPAPARCSRCPREDFQEQRIGHEFGEHRHMTVPSHHRCDQLQSSSVTVPLQASRCSVRMQLTFQQQQQQHDDVPPTETCTARLHIHTP